MNRDLFKIQLREDGNIYLMINEGLMMEDKTLEKVRKSFDDVVDALEDDEQLVLPKATEEKIND